MGAHRNGRLQSGVAKGAAESKENLFLSWIFLGNVSLASTSSGGQPFRSEWIEACLHAGTTGSSPVSWTINQAPGHGEVPAGDRRGPLGHTAHLDLHRQ